MKEQEAHAVGSRWLWLAVCVLAALSAVATLAIYAIHVPDFFEGDDFDLVGDALAGESLLIPVSAHLRPVIRAHFYLYRLFGTASVFGALSLLLHAAACGVVYVLLREIYGRAVALPAALLFFTCFLANEAVYWASAAAVLYCMIFSGLSLWFFVRGRLLVAYLLLLPAALSHELWMVAPVLFLFHRRNVKELILPFLLVVAFVSLQALTFGSGGASAYGGFSIRELVPRFARFLNPLATNPPFAVALVLCVLVLMLFAVPRLRFAATLYTTSALLLSFSNDVSSRFYYFPSLAVILVIALGLTAARPAPRIASAALAVALAFASPWVNFLDGEDYGRRAALHEELYRALDQRIGLLQEDGSAVLVSRLGPQRLATTLSELRGRPKVVFVRGPAIGGMIYPDDLVRMSSWKRGLAPLPNVCEGKTIEIGREEVRSTYCFRVGARPGSR